MKQISINENGFEFEGGPFALLGELAELARAIGQQPNREFAGANTIYIWDELGVVAYQKPGESQVHQVSIWFRNADYPFSPSANYAGTVSLNGVGIHADSSRADLKKSGLDDNDYGSDFEFYSNNSHIFAHYKEGVVEIGAVWYDSPTPVVLADDTPIDSTIRCVTYSQFVDVTTKYAAGPKDFDSWNGFHRALADILMRYGEVTGNTAEEDPDFYHSGDWFDTYADGFSIINTKVLLPGLLSEILRCVMRTHPAATVEFSGIEGPLDDISIGVSADGIYANCAHRTPVECAEYLTKLGGDAAPHANI